ncbi:hypothetical protein D6D21_06036 [Aureobasidium pullulans]|uniref:Rhodopsin domain-containing protein n=1 Tax=Aureobasidium pullulans TaxID=5580 RepID=A0AB74IVE0_AURPU|nr:hypothetical protein D6D21_06036 [Aureobasidium pullulans]
MALLEDAHGEISVGALKGSTAADLYRFSIPLMVLTSLFLGVRVYVRGYMTKTFGIEDWFIIPAYLTIGNSVLFIVDQIFIKLSVAAYFYRICEGWQRYVIVGSVTIFSLFNFAFLFVSLFQCGIPTVINLLTASTTEACISWPRIVKPLLYVGVSLNAACDWVFVLACLPVLSKLRRMPTSEMLCVCFLIFLATGASVLSLVRIRYLPAGGTDVLLLKHNDDFAVLSFVEAGTAIITVCMATLHPLFQAFARKRGSSKYPATSSPRRDDSEQTPSEKKRSEPSSEEWSTEHSDIGRIGVLPTIYDTEMIGTMTEREPPRHYTDGWNS